MPQYSHYLSEPKMARLLVRGRFMKAIVLNDCMSDQQQNAAENTQTHQHRQDR
jgi:hypothetical protein